jgi:hypothetical protein
MKNNYSFLFILVTICFMGIQSSNAQNWVINYQKISNTHGNFGNNLSAGDSFGHSLDSIGDINGDGVTDAIVTAFGDDQVATDMGALYILKLNIDGTVKSFTKITKNLNGFTGDIESGDIFGSGFAAIGDYNNDGFYDVAVGAEYDDDGGMWNGAIYLLSLDTSGNVLSNQKISATSGGFTGTLTGTPAFGCDIASIGDLNGDGVNDLAVGSRRDGDGGTYHGALWILFMNANGTVHHQSKISDTQGNFTANLDTEDYFGVSVEYLGDFNNDGYIELAVGSHYDDDGGTNKGSIYILSIDTGGSVVSYSKISDLSGGFSGVLNSGDKFGISIAKIGDLDNDGVIDIAVGAYRDNTAGTDAGAFYILYMNVNGTVKSHLKITEGLDGFSGDLDTGDLFGMALSSVGKFGDFFTLMVGTRLDDDSATDAGAAYMLFIRGQITSDINNLILTKEVVYNNPVQDILYIKTELNNSTFYLYDTSGKLVRQVKLENKNLQMNVSNLSKGLYIGVLENGDYRKTMKLIIE